MNKAKDAQIIRALKRLSEDGYTKADEWLVKIKGKRGAERAVLLWSANEYIEECEHYRYEVTGVICPICHTSWTIVYMRPPRDEEEEAERRQCVEQPQACTPCQYGFTQASQDLRERLRHQEQVVVS